MKKKLCMILVLITCFYCTTVTINVNPKTENSIIIEKITENLGDGIYLETIIEEEISLVKASIKTGTKTVNYKSGNTILWSVSVKGTFTYNGSTSSCTSATVSASSSNSKWKVSNLKSSKSGNTAIGSATGKRYNSIGVVDQTITREVRLTCTKGSVK